MGDDTFSDLWQCDGCGLLGTFDELDRHVQEVNLDPDGGLVPVEDTVCWGSMQVGGPAWQAYEFDGLHPMAMMLAHVATAYGIDLGGEERV